MRKSRCRTIFMLLAALSVCLLSVPAISGENPWDADKPGGDREVLYPGNPGVVVIARPSTSSASEPLDESRLTRYSFTNVWMSFTRFVVKSYLIEKSNDGSIRDGR